MIWIPLSCVTALTAPPATPHRTIHIFLLLPLVGFQGYQYRFQPESI